MRPMRRRDKRISDEQCLQALKDCKFGVMATCGKDNIPYGVPISYVYYDNAIYFHCFNKGHKLDNITENPKVSFTVVDKVITSVKDYVTNFESVIVFGTAEKVENEEKETALKKLVEKYTPDLMDLFDDTMKKEAHLTTVVRINIEDMCGKGRYGE